MSLTAKLILGFLFALALQITQILISGYFTNRVQEASNLVANALSASLAVQNGLEAVTGLRNRCELARRGVDGRDCRVQGVFVDELGLQLRELHEVLPDAAPAALAQLDRRLAALVEQQHAVAAAARRDHPEEDGDALAVLDDAASQFEQDLRQFQVRVKALAHDGVQRAQAVQDLPLRAAVALAVAGVVVMALFVAWFSRQLVLPIQRAHAELEQRVADRTRELADTVEELEGEIVQRKATEAQKEQLHRQLMETSRRAGMAELANGVLHNVGNVLNSVNVSADLLGQGLRESRIAGIERVAALLREHAGDLAAFVTSQRGSTLPDYLQQLAEQLAHERTVMLDEAASLCTRIDHLKEIVSRQQSYARCAGVRATVDVAQLVDEVLGMHRGQLLQLGIEIALHIDGDATCELDRSRVLQVLMNLISNAKHAIRDAGREGGRIDVTIRRCDDRVTIAVADNGVGIAPEDLTHVFRHGFTTKADGHGFGLHHSANAATEMGGRLRADSAGRGHGATFTLELPLAAQLAESTA